MVRGSFGVLLTGMLTAGLCQARLAQRFVYPFPSLLRSLSTPEADLQDFAGIALGWRRLAADMAWIQTLQYYGTPEPGQSEFEFENGIGQYAKFLPYCQRVARIDPYFTYVYYYGGAVLGWNLNRLEEAERLLKEGVANNPKEWRLSQYLAGLAYQKNHDVVHLMGFLETVVSDPQCPNLVKALLANIYKKQRDYKKALILWADIYASGEPDYTSRALKQIQIINQLMH